MVDGEITARLDLLEKQNRRMKRIGAFAIVAAVSLLIIGQAPGKRTVSANEFTLIDGNGKLRAVWGIVENSPQITFFDETSGIGNISVSLLKDGSPSLVLMNGESTINIDIPTAQEIGTQNRMVNTHQPIRAEIEFKYGKRIHMLLFDQAPVGQAGEATALQMFTNGSTRQNSTATITMFGKGTNALQPPVFWSAP